MTKKALIVGSGGQDGTLLSQLLTRRSYEVTGLKRNDLDILSPKNVIEFVDVLKPAEIYYLAAFHHSSENLPPSSGDLFRQSMDVHFYGVVNFLDAITKTSPVTRIVFASSSHIFGAVESGSQTESTIYDPQSEYAITKVAGMRACQHYRRTKNVFASIGILFNHESSLRKSSFLSKKIAIAAARIAHEGGGTLELGDLDAQIDWGDATDTVDAMHRILQVEKPSDYVVATGHLSSVRDFAEVAFKYVDLDYSKYVVSKKNEALRNNYRRVGDSSKLKKDTGWMPSISFEQMVKNLVQFEIDTLRSNAKQTI
jgi:GDPmannose 4,6-dehydratase